MTINFLNIAQVLVAMALIGFILIQRGPGATAGSAFGGGGGGASGTVFGAKGSGSFLTKATAILATLFFIITMLIAIDARNSYSSTGDAAEQDLGVFGSLDDEQEPSLVPTGDVEPVDAGMNDVLDAVEQTADKATDAVTESVDAVKADAVDAVKAEATDAVDAVEQKIDESTDSDGENN